MSNHPLDKREVIQNLFYPRKSNASTNMGDMIKDGTISVDEDVEIGYRLYIKHSSAPILLYFHGNGEIASDYDSIAPYYHNVGVSLLVVDYRGYGWSTGTPLTTRLLPDAQKVLDSIDTILSDSGVIPGRPLFLKGRSLGSAPAIYLAMTNPDKLQGLIIESGYADAPSLFRRLGITIPDDVHDDPALPINNDEKMKKVTIPTLVIHGERDMLIPVHHGKALYENAAAEDKELVIIPGAGHNNILFMDISRYFDAVKRFVDAHSG